MCVFEYMCVCVLWSKTLPKLSNSSLMMYERETDSVSCENKCKVCSAWLPVMHKTNSKIGLNDICLCVLQCVCCKDCIMWEAGHILFIKKLPTKGKCISSEWYMCSNLALQHKFINKSFYSFLSSFLLSALCKVILIKLHTFYVCHTNTKM